MINISKKQAFSVLLIAIIIFLIFYLSSILLPFFIGIFVAYLLDPIVDWFEKKNIKRGLGAAITLILFAIIIFITSFLILPVLLAQIKSFLIDFPQVIDDLNKKFNFLINYIQKRIIFSNVSSNVNEFLPDITNILIKFLKGLFFSSLAIFNVITIFLVTPIVSWYFLKDWDTIISTISDHLSSKYNILLIDYTSSINSIFDAYLRGQMLVSISLSIFYFISFYILGLDYSLFVGIFAGFFSFIPIIGIVISLFVTSVLAYLQFVEFYLLLYVFLIFLIGQLLESNFLTPKLIGKKLGLHPLIVLLAIFIFGSLFGILGIIFSTPLMAIMILIFKKNLLTKNV